MNSYGNHQAIQQYARGAVQTQVSEATPHGLVQLMLDGATARIAAARGAMEAGETARKGELIGKAIDLVEGLRISLDGEQGGELAQNLDALYRYMGERLVEANLRNDARLLEEVSRLLREISAGWRAISPIAAAREGRDPSQRPSVAG